MSDDLRAWRAGKVIVAMPGGPVERAGYVWRGLGLFQAIPASAKGKRPPTWSLTHIGSGHAVAFLKGDVATVFPIASEIALAGDWTFEGLGGWRNQFPDAAERFYEIMARFPKIVSRGAHGGANEATAREVAMRVGA